jgi:RNA polymerase sigma-54 factor
MRLSFGLETRQVQVQKLAPRMIQSMEILQLPVMALQERIEQELNENPVLELAEEDAAALEEPVETVSPDAPAESEKELVVDEKSDNVEDFDCWNSIAKFPSISTIGRESLRIARKRMMTASTMRSPTSWIAPSP